MCKTCIEREDKCENCKNGLYKLESANLDQFGKCYPLASFPDHFIDDKTSLITSDSKLCKDDKGSKKKLKKYKY